MQKAAESYETTDIFPRGVPAFDMVTSGVWSDNEQLKLLTEE
jgi:hypothetical protein